jgi:hypothetical protein
MGLDLNQTATEISRLCTGEYTVDEIAERLARTYVDVSFAAVERDVNKFLSALADRGLLQGQE